MSDSRTYYVAVTTFTRPRVFLCHAHLDKSRARWLYNRLKAAGVDPWLDEESLLPGEDWELEISRAIGSADYVVACLSKNSVDTRGYFQREIRLALDVLDEMPEGAPFLIPIRFDECDPPKRLVSRHWIDMFADDPTSFARLMRVIRGSRQARSEKGQSPTGHENTPPVCRSLPDALDTTDPKEAEEEIIKYVSYELGLAPTRPARLSLPRTDVQALDHFDWPVDFTAAFERENEIIGLYVRHVRGDKIRRDVATDVVDKLRSVSRLHLRGAPREISVVVVLLAQEGAAGLLLTRAAIEEHLNIHGGSLPNYEIRSVTFRKSDSAV